MRRALPFLALAGCSAFFMDKPSRPYDPARHGEPRCSRKMDLPVTDLLLGVGQFAVAYAVTRAEPDCDTVGCLLNDLLGRAVAVGMLAVSGGAFVISGATGAGHWAPTCRSQHQQWEASLLPPAAGATQPATRPFELGGACKDPLPGVPNTGRCPRGYLCRGTECVPAGVTPP